jgi:hypothetical protein
MSARILGPLFGVALALTVTTAGAAENAYRSANAILPPCRDFVNQVERNSPAAEFHKGICMGIVMTITLMGNVTKLLLEDNSEDGGRLAGSVRRVVCLDIPEGVTFGQQARVVVRYIEARPARMREPFDRLAAEALRTAWPCR